MTSRVNQADDLQDARAILVVLPTWVGDFVMATPLLRAIRHRFQNGSITFLAEPNLRDLIRGGDWMDTVLHWPDKAHRNPWHAAYRRLVRRLRQDRHDAAILLPNSFRSALTVFLARIPRRIGYDRDGRGWTLTDRIPVRNRHRTSPSPQPIQAPTSTQSAPSARPTTPPPPPRRGRRFEPMPLVEYYADLAEVLGCDRPGDDLHLFTTPDCESAVDTRLAGLAPTDRPSPPTATPGPDRTGPLVVISPGAKYGAAKCWPAERFARVADSLITRTGAHVLITCGPGEQPIAHAIASAMQQPAPVLDDPILTLGQLKSLIRRADLLLCNDAGPRHFAKAFNVPLVTVFGPTHPEWTRTGYARERIVRLDVDCGPCQHRSCPLQHWKCMLDLEPETVTHAALDLLQPQSEPRP